ncbi:hypothetical protein LMH87_004329 [Akanthomyces muscarius]|uniref:Uncharacterized protein n=1 Tax=Akanthomyces muscarius TaxID=2231603 RepID=A0A9W8Q4E0_AKAMU|nr:hypothetical protein LMH87_004329 [Akanthomyces muscarius]KAJ4145480.1 hypothetical protein LMH87_004329 [Akanthomyces muscarius]
MGDSVNIQNLLQAGYFKTSRNRSKSPGYDHLDQDEEPRRVGRSRDDYDYEKRHDRPRLSPSPIRLPPPPAHARAAFRSRSGPPRPAVDDEDSILKKEHGYRKTPPPEEEAASRGDADQEHVIMEVHEFNPERRFVILDDDEPATSTIGGKPNSSEQNAESRPKSNENLKPEACPDGSSKYHRRAPSAGLSPTPPTGRRRSRQDLPVLETEFVWENRQRDQALCLQREYHHGQESQNFVQSPLPYPEEDVFHVDPLSVPRDAKRSANGFVPTVSMPTLPPEPTAGATPRQKSGDADAPRPVSPAPEAKEWKPASFDPAKDGVKPERPVGTYRRYSENKNAPASDQLPNCPRINPVVGKVDWLTLPRTDFNICPECYGQVFSNSDYRTDFHPVLRPTVDAIACDFGSSPWYRIAWLLILKNKDPDLRVFHDIAAISTAARGYRCPGDRKTTRDWYTIRDPYTKRPVPEFTVCYQCAKTVEALLPNLSGIFVPLDLRSSLVRSTCALHFAPDRTDFVLYFDSFETTADKAHSSKKSPDLGYLAQKLERLSVHNACREDKPITDGYWHCMQYLPQFTVCADCFEDVVQPRLSEDNVIARNFYIKPQKIQLATCQLYSPRMRDVFKRACRRDDPKYLEGKVRERLDIESSIKSKLAKLDRDGKRDPRTEKQIDDLIEEWKEWE